MMRLVNLFALVLAAFAVIFLYDYKYEARRFEKRVQELNKQIAKEQDAIAVLKAEWSHLNQPHRVERLARKFLPLKSANERQIILSAQPDKTILQILQMRGSSEVKTEAPGAALRPGQADQKRAQ